MANGPTGPSQPHFDAVSREIKRLSPTHLILPESQYPPQRTLDRADRVRRERCRGPQPSAPSGSHRDVARILLVDDDADVLQSTREMLEAHGYEVLVAEDGAHALASAERDAPDLVILDVVMPHHSGLSVLQRLRRGSKRPPKIIVVTGNAEPRVRQLAHSAGVDAFVRKPFDVDQLLATIEQLLRQL